MAGYGVPHDVHEGDVVEIGWAGGPIDVLFLDLLKTWEINDAVLHDFFPHVVPAARFSYNRTTAGASSPGSS